jgi:hypothetical protein
LNYLYGYTESYELEYIPLNETEVRRSTLPGITFDELFSLDEKRYPPGSLVEFNCSPDDQYAYLRISTFDDELLKDSKINYEKFLAESFQHMETRQIGNLILDLRSNGGGTDAHGKILFSYFANQPFEYYSSLTMRKESYDFFKYTHNPGRRAPKGMLQANLEGTFDNVKHPNVGKQANSCRCCTFKPKLFLLEKKAGAVTMATARVHRLSFFYRIQELALRYRS